MSAYKSLALGATLAVASIGAFAQAATPRVDGRQHRQETRIDAGVASGKLTARRPGAWKSSRSTSTRSRPGPRPTARSPPASAAI